MSRAASSGHCATQRARHHRDRHLPRHGTRGRCAVLRKARRVAPKPSRKPLMCSRLIFLACSDVGLLALFSFTPRTYPTRAARTSPRLRTYRYRPIQSDVPRKSTPTMSHGIWLSQHGHRWASKVIAPFPAGLILISRCLYWV